MPLANIRHLSVTDEDRRVYDFHHWQDHLALLLQANRTLGTKLIARPIWPLPDHDTFLKLHQDMHDSLAAALGLDNTDLGALDLQDGRAVADWSFRNYKFHEAAHAKLGLT